MNDIVLNVLPADSDDSRIVVAMEQDESGKRQMVLRQESLSRDVGWFVQSRVVVQANQVNALKASFSSQDYGQQKAPTALGNAAGALMIQKPLSRRAIAPVWSTNRPSITGAIAHRLTKICHAYKSTSGPLIPPTKIDL